MSEPPHTGDERIDAALRAVGDADPERRAAALQAAHEELRRVLEGE